MSGRLSRQGEDDNVPLRGTETKKLIVYSDDNFVGCAGWLCCASVGPSYSSPSPLSPASLARGTPRACARQVC
jgi:hypothetical protein